MHHPANKTARSFRGLGALLLLALAIRVAPSPGAEARPQESAGSSPQSAFVGAETCMTCHEAQGKAYHASAMGRSWNPRAPAADRGCETCHGPGQGHVDDPGDKTLIRNPLTMAPRDVSEVCTSCHNRNNHVYWQGSMHDSRNLSCVTCHSMHSPQSERAQLKKAGVVETCATCHRDKAAKLLRSGHMPVREGKMDCSSCHNQHGSPNERLLRVGNSINEFCGSCHAEKRGPFLWEHAPVREKCTTCHDPHGSSNDRLLVAKVPMLCQRCHIHTRHPATVYDGLQLANRSNRIVSRGCVNCHANIHGSNHPSGQFFHR